MKRIQFKISFTQSDSVLFHKPHLCFQRSLIICCQVTNSRDNTERFSIADEDLTVRYSRKLQD